MTKKKAVKTATVIKPILHTHTANGFNIGRVDSKIFIINPLTDEINQFDGTIEDAIIYCNSQATPQ